MWTFSGRQVRVTSPQFPHPMQSDSEPCPIQVIADRNVWEDLPAAQALRRGVGTAAHARSTDCQPNAHHDRQLHAAKRDQEVQGHVRSRAVRPLHVQSCVQRPLFPGECRLESLTFWDQLQTLEGYLHADDCTRCPQAPLLAVASTNSTFRVPTAPAHHDAVACAVSVCMPASSHSGAVQGGNSTAPPRPGTDAISSLQPFPVIIRAHGRWSWRPTGLDDMGADAPTSTTADACNAGAQWPVGMALGEPLLDECPDFKQLQGAVYDVLWLLKGDDTPTQLLRRLLLARAGDMRSSAGLYRLPPGDDDCRHNGPDHDNLHEGRPRLFEPAWPMKGLHLPSTDAEHAAFEALIRNEDWTHWSFRLARQLPMLSLEEQHHCLQLASSVERIQLCVECMLRYKEALCSVQRKRHSWEALGPTMPSPSGAKPLPVY